MWMKRWANEWNSRVVLNDVTSMFTALNVVGPASRYLMYVGFQSHCDLHNSLVMFRQDVTGQKMHASDFPSFAYRELNIGMATGVRAYVFENF